MNRLRIGIPVLVTLALALAARPAAAQRQESGDTVPLYVLEGVTVTTTRIQADRSRIPQKVDVLDSVALAAGVGQNIAQALRSLTPIEVIDYPGLLTGVAIRGFRPQFTGISPRTLVLLNGRPAGTNNLAIVHRGSIDRIEILRGPASAMYGSSAMGGVVNLITRRSIGAPTGAVSVGYGSFGAYDVAARAGGALSESVDFDVDLASVGQRSGYRLGSSRGLGADSLQKTLPNGAGTTVPWTGADSTLSFVDYGSFSGGARVGYSIDPSWRIDFSGEAYRALDVRNPGDLNAVDYDGRSTKDVNRHSLDVLATGSLGRHELEARLFDARETVVYFNAPERPNFVNFRTPTRTSGVQIQEVVRLGSHALTAGIDYTSAVARSEAYDGPSEPGSPFSPDVAVRSGAVFSQVHLGLFADRVTVSAGGRVDRVTFEVLSTPNLEGYPANTERHLVATPTLGIRSAAVGGGLQLVANYGRGFVTPDAFHVAGYHERSAGGGRAAVFVTRGDPDLEPETSRGWDVGTVFRPANLGVEAEFTYFRNDVQGRIGTRLIQGSGQLTAGGDTILSTTTYVNVDEATLRGVEASAAIDVAALLDLPHALRLFASGTRMLRADEQLTAESRSQRIRNVADLTVIAGADFDVVESLSGRLSGRYVGERVDADYVAWWEPGEILYPAYLVFDLTGSLRIRDGLRGGLEARNLTDQDYFEVRGFNLPGRSIRASLQLDF